MKRNLLIVFFLQQVVLAQSPFLDSVKNVLKRNMHDTARCRNLNLLIQNDYDPAVWPKYNKEVRAIAQKNLKGVDKPTTKLDTFFLRTLAGSYNNEGYEEFYNKSNFNEAIKFFTKGLEIDRSINNLAGVADAYNALGVIYDNKGETTRSLEYQFLALEIKEKSDDKRGMAIIMDNIGETYSQNGNNIKALEYYKQSLKIFKEEKDASGYANVLVKLGGMHRDNDRLDSALSCYTEALGIMEKVGDPVAIGGILVSIGNVYSIYEDPNCDPAKTDCSKIRFLKAKEYYLRAIEFHKKSGSKSGMGVSKQRLAWMEYKMNNLKESKVLALEALALAKELGAVVQISKCSELLYKIEKKQGNGLKALEYFEQFIVMRDSVSNVENQKAFLKKQMEYDFNKQKEIDKANSEKELAIAEERGQKQKLISVFAGIGLLLVLIFSAIIFNRLRLTSKQKQIIEQKNHLIEEKQKEILDSIHYAKRIQSTILAHTDFLNEHIPSNFIYFKPKDIVSGDFYWASRTDDAFYLAVCDSTGHGVPGAFMSLLNIGFLNEAINEKKIREPNKIFDHVRERLVNSISKEGQRDGFDGVLLCIDQRTKKITYAAANNEPVIVRGNEILELTSNRMPVGIGEIQAQFDKYEIQLNRGDVLYLYTDGYADQFGGPKGKKYKYRQLNELLKRIASLEMKGQQLALDHEFEIWRGKLEQVDDVCVIGIRV